MTVNYRIAQRSVSRFQEGLPVAQWSFGGGARAVEMLMVVLSVFFSDIFSDIGVGDMAVIPAARILTRAI